MEGDTRVHRYVEEMIRWLSAVALALILAFPPMALAQSEEGSNGPVEVKEPAPVPFGVGEKLIYRVKFGPVEVGEGRMSVVEIDTVSGHPTYHMRFDLEGGTFFYKIDDTQESWLDIHQLASRRFKQDLQQGDYERLRIWEIDLENKRYVRNDGETDSIPDNALDEASFIYFIRSIPLEVGATYEWNRHFRWEKNPVILKVLRREKVKVPEGEFETLVVRPIIKAGGIYAEEGEAEVYITDDERRIPVMLKSKLKVGSLTMELKEYVEGEKVGTSH